MKEDVGHRFQRLLSLLNTIKDKPGQSAQDLAEQFGTSKRNLFRDIKLLQDSGFTIDREGGYRLSGSPAGLASADQPVAEQGLQPWDQPAAGAVRLEVKVEAALARTLLHTPLHPSQQIQGDRLTVTANPDRMADWLMSVQGAELLEPGWLRGSLARRAQELLKRYS
jgi:predicted DNA-binding transcriptional regulator YafY